jgi:large subunit ribosomal protein L25
MDHEITKEADSLVELAANIRQVGKKAINLLRKEGEIPAVIYGKDLAEQILITVSKKEFTHKMKEALFNTKITLNIKDNKGCEVLIKAINHSLVKGDIIHIDFIHISDKAEDVICYVPLKFINEGLSPALKRGGVLNIIHRKVCIKCNKNDMPKYLTVDLTGMEGASVITTKQVALPNPDYKLLVKNEKQAIASIIGGKASAVSVESSSAAAGKKKTTKKK